MMIGITIYVPRWAGPVAIAIAFFTVQPARAAQNPHVPAFPAAEGFGTDTPGGRTGQVLLVTNLKDYHPRHDEPIPGSLRAACTTAGPRIVVFQVAGTIALKTHLAITEPFLTIAGQTAFGRGICIKNYGTTIRRTHDIIIRYMRFRPGDTVGRQRHQQGKSWAFDALSVYASHDVVIDHCSTAWGSDETLSLTGVGLDRITVQWTMITESLNDAFHHKGPHGYGSIIGGHIGHGKTASISIHHCLYAHHAARNPHFAGDRDGQPPGSRTEFRNNVVYDWGHVAAHNYTPQYTTINFIANYLKPGPSTHTHQRKTAFTSGSDNAHLYIADNVLEGYPAARRDNSLLVDAHRGLTSMDRPFDAPPVTTTDAETAFEQVLENAGATLPVRDAVDARVVEAVRTGGGRIIDSQSQVGGWPQYAGGHPPPDEDRDGMPDKFERQHGLDPTRADDAALDDDNDVYTNIEEYINATDPTHNDT